MLVVLLIAISAVLLISSVLIVGKAGEKENLCNYDHHENEETK